MRIGLVDVDGRGFPNLALMKLAAVVIDFVPFAQWDDLPSLEHDIRADDCLWFVMSRRDRVSYNPVMSRIPAYLEHFFSGYSSVLLYPVQAGDTESRYI